MAEKKPSRVAGTSKSARRQPGDEAEEERALQIAGRKHRAALYGTSVHALFTALSGGRLDLLEFLKAFVEEAASRGWLRVDESGFAQPRREDLDVATRDAVVAALQLPEVQRAALLALDVPMVDVGLLEALEASALVPDLALVAVGAIGGAPGTSINRVSAIVSRIAERKAFSWEEALELAVRSACREDKLDARGKVDHALAMLRTLASEGIPSALLEPNAGQQRAARTFMRSVRHADIKDQFRPPGARLGGGKPLSARGAASAFAACFGLEIENRRSRVATRKN